MNTSRNTACAFLRSVSGIGYDDEEIPTQLKPMLTTANQPHREMGEWAVERLIGTDDHGHGPAAEKLECELVPRHSVAARKRLQPRQAVPVFARILPGVTPPRGTIFGKTAHSPAPI